jgi:hypothetical protein
MRYYRIDIFKPGAAAGSTPFRSYTSYPKVGQSYQVDPGALNITLDAYVFPFASPGNQQSAVQIWGIPISDISQASNFNYCTINVYAGFQKGLPLNNPAQAGLILTGMIQMAYGNWSGTDMTLDFVVVTGGSIAAQNSNIVLAWLAGQPLATSMANMLSVAFPGIKQAINISPKLVINHTEVGVYPSLIAFARQIKSITQEVIGGGYLGVDIVLTPTGFRIVDASTPTSPVQIAFQDLIGQATWILPNTIQFMCPMRADLSVGDYIQMPKNLLGVPGAVVTTPASIPQQRQQSIFNGSFYINSVHHMGDYRQPDGTSWATVFEALSTAPTAPVAP